MTGGAGSGRERFVRCPACGQPTRYAADNPWRPFCSERCRGVDLGAWASEAYRFAAPGSEAADDTSEADEAAGRATAQSPDRPH